MAPGNAPGAGGRERRAPGAEAPGAEAPDRSLVIASGS